MDQFDMDLSSGSASEDEGEEMYEEGCMGGLRNKLQFLNCFPKTDSYARVGYAI